MEESTAWRAAERLLVCVSASPLSGRVIRTAHRMAVGFGAQWLALAVETPPSAQGADAARARLLEHLRLAAALGAETHTVSDREVAAAIVGFAVQHDVTMIVIGKPTHSRWKDRLFGSLVDEVVRSSGTIEVHVVSGAAEPSRTTMPAQRWSARLPHPREMLLAAIVAGAAALLSQFLSPWVTHSDQVMLFMLGVAFVAYRARLQAALATALFSIAAFDFFFVPPVHSFAVESTQYLLTFVVMGVLSIVVSGLVWRMRAEADSARAQQRTTALMFELVRRLSAANDEAEVASIGVDELARAFGVDVSLFLRSDGELALARAHGPPLDPTCVAADALSSTSVVSGVDGYHAPLIADRGYGVVSLRIAQRDYFDHPERRHLLETMITHIAQAFERVSLERVAQAASVELETERVRNSLLSSISHDLRTPLASVIGSMELLIHGDVGTSRRREELLEGAHNELRGLNRVLDNVLELTRIEGGGLSLNPQLLVPEETIGAVLRRLHDRRRHHDVTTSVDVDLGRYDETSIETALVNLVENALRYSDPGTTVHVMCHAEGGELVFEVADEGPGFDLAEREMLFRKFSRGARRGEPGGAGLGLAIVASVATAHEGRVFAEPRDGGGSRFGIAIPQPAELSQVMPEI